MPRPTKRDITPGGETLRAEVDEILIAGLAGGGASVTFRGTIANESESVIERRASLSVDQSEDIDENGTSDLVQSFNAARAAVGLPATLTAPMVRDLLVEWAFQVAELKKGNR